VSFTLRLCTHTRRHSRRTNWNQAHHFCRSSKFTSEVIFSYTAIFSWYETENDGSVLGIIVVLPFLVLLLLAFDTVMTWDGAAGRKRMRVYRSIVIWKIHGAEGLRSILSSFVWNCKPILMLATCDTWQFSHTSFFFLSSS